MYDKITFRLVIADDLPALDALVAKNDPAIVHLMRAEVTRWLVAPREPEAFYVVETADRIVGMGGYVADSWGVGDIAWLVWFYFDPERQREGLGRWLYAHIEAELASAGLRKIYLDVGNEADHAAAIAFHRANGFVQTATLKDYWKDGEDFLVFEKRLR